MRRGNEKTTGTAIPTRLCTRGYTHGTGRLQRSHSAWLARSLIPLSFLFIASLVPSLLYPGLAFEASFARPARTLHRSPRDPARAHFGSKKIQWASLLASFLRAVLSRVPSTHEMPSLVLLPLLLLLYYYYLCTLYIQCFST